jgi:cystathionine gamma-synthase
MRLPWSARFFGQECTGAPSTPTHRASPAFNLPHRSRAVGGGAFPLPWTLLSMGEKRDTAGSSAGGTMTNIRTTAIHAGRPHGQPGEPVAQSLTLASSFYTAPDVPIEFGQSVAEPLPFYTRWGNPTVRLLERRMAALEGAEDGLCFGSGMGAIAALLLATLRGGDHLVISDVCYAGVAELVHDTLPPLGISVSSVDTSDLAAVKQAIRPNTRLVYAETPANPILKLTDIAGLAEITRAAKIELAIDSTLATPIATRPIVLGSDFVVHSLTKYACGHGDTLGGIILGASQRLTEIRQSSLIHLGAAMHPFAAWLIERSLHTLPQRMAAHQNGALAVARFLSTHEKVARVFYPGLRSHPQHDLAERQMSNFSGMIAAQLFGGGALAQTISQRVKVFAYAVSLGKSHSNLYYYPTETITQKSFHLSGKGLAAYRKYAGDGIFRISIGLEDPDDLIDDLMHALS